MEGVSERGRKHGVCMRGRVCVCLVRADACACVGEVSGVRHVTSSDVTKATGTQLPPPESICAFNARAPPTSLCPTLSVSVPVSASVSVSVSVFLSPSSGAEAASSNRGSALADVIDTSVLCVWARARVCVYLCVCVCVCV